MCSRAAKPSVAHTTTSQRGSQQQLGIIWFFLPLAVLISNKEQKAAGGLGGRWKSGSCRFLTAFHFLQAMLRSLPQKPLPQTVKAQKPPDKPGEPQPNPTLKSIDDQQQHWECVIALGESLKRSADPTSSPSGETMVSLQGSLLVWVHAWHHQVCAVPFLSGAGSVQRPQEGGRKSECCQAALPLAS